MRGYDPSRESSDGRSRALPASTTPPPTQEAALAHAVSAPAALPAVLASPAAADARHRLSGGGSSRAPRLSQGLSSGRSSSARRALALDKEPTPGPMQPRMSCPGRPSSSRAMVGQCKLNR